MEENLMLRNSPSQLHAILTEVNRPCYATRTRTLIMIAYVCMEFSIRVTDGNAGMQLSYSCCIQTRLRDEKTDSVAGRP